MTLDHQTILRDPFIFWIQERVEELLDFFSGNQTNQDGAVRTQQTKQKLAELH